MIDTEEDSQSPFIADTFVTCLVLYRKFHSCIASDERRIRCQVDLAKVSDEYGRLNVWGSDSGALRSGRGSLDDALRNDENLKSIVLDIVNDLIDAIKRGMLCCAICPDFVPILLTPQIAISASEHQETADPADQEGAERSDDESLSSVSTSSETSIEETKQRRPKRLNISTLSPAFSSRFALFTRSLRFSDALLYVTLMFVLFRKMKLFRPTFLRT